MSTWTTERAEMMETSPPHPGSAASNISTFLDSEFRYILFPVAYGIIFVLGLLANAYVLFVMRNLRKLKRMGEILIYMTNLTVADLLFVSALPFWIGYYSRHGHWVYSDFMCRLTGSFFFINTYCSILFLGAITVNRHWAVVRPLDAASSDHRCRGIVVCIIIWGLTISMAIPSLMNPGIQTDQNNITRCFEGFQNQTDNEKKLIAAIHLVIIAAFFVVFFLIVVCNSLTARALVFGNTPQCSTRSKSSLSRKSRALQTLLAVVAVFALCFLPHHVIQGPWTLAVLQIQKGWGQVDWDQNTLQALNDTHQITLLFMGLNCLLDPVVYFFATTRFRKYIMAHIKKIGKGEGCSQTAVTDMSLESRKQSLADQSLRQHPGHKLADGNICN